MLEVTPTNRTIYDKEGRKTAGVKIICHEDRCPLNEKFAPNSEGGLHIDPSTLIGQDIRELKPEVIDFIISDGKFLERASKEGYILNQLVTSFALAKDNQENIKAFKKLLADEDKWVFTGSTAPPRPDSD